VVRGARDAPGARREVTAAAGHNAAAEDFDVRMGNDRVASPALPAGSAIGGYGCAARSSRA
jgi:hypothetical protein